jgi:hypothetical protein
LLIWIDISKKKDYHRESTYLNTATNNFLEGTPPPGGFKIW